MNAPALAPYHPQWSDVSALDRQIAWVSAYRPAAAAPGRVATVSTPVIPAPAPTRIVANLEKTISDRLGTEYSLQRNRLEQRLARLRRESRASVVLARRNEISTWADEQFQIIVDRHGLEIQRMDLRIAALDSLMQTYVARGWDRDVPAPPTVSPDVRKPAKPGPEVNRGRVYRELEAQRQEVRDRLAAVRAQAGTEIDAVFAEVKSRFADEEAKESAANLRWMQEHRQVLADLDNEILRQKALLVDTLRNVTAPTAAFTPGVVLPVSAAAPSVAPAPLEPVGLQPSVDSLLRRRRMAARFVLRNTMAIVRSEASRRGQSVSFTPAAGLPDATSSYQGAVRNTSLGLGGRL